VLHTAALPHHILLSIFGQKKTQNSDQGQNMTISFALVLNGSAALSLPLSYAITKKGSHGMKQAWIALLWLLFLGLPFWGASEEQGALPIHTFGTMMTSALAFIFPLKVMQMVLFPYEMKTSKKDEKEKKYRDPREFSLREGLEFSGQCSYYALPVNPVQNPKKETATFVVQQNVYQFSLAVLKIVLLQFFGQVLVQVTERNPDPSTRGPLVYMQMSVVFTFVFIAANCINDLEGIVVQVLSLGRYGMLPRHRFPFVSTSIREFWGHRYDILITTLLRDTVYGPCRSSFGWEQDVSGLAVFTTSGILHSYVAHFTFGCGTVRSFVFFIIQPP
jgi:hypothetical protein